MKGWDGRTTSLTGNRPTSLGVSRRSRDSRPRRRSAVIGSAWPVRRLDAHRALPPLPTGRPKSPEGPSYAFVPLQRYPSQSRTVPASPWASASDHASSPGLSCPTTHSRIGGLARSRHHPRSPATCGVWLPPARPDEPPSLPARMAPERPWASPFKAFPSCRSGTPFGGLALLALSATVPHPKVHTTARPTSGPRSLHERVPSPIPRGDRPSQPSWDSSLQSVLPIRPGPALWSRGRPSHPDCGLTSQPERVTGSCEADGAAWSVSGLPALLGFFTF